MGCLIGRAASRGRLGVAAYQVGGFDFESELLLLKILCEVSISFCILDYGRKGSSAQRSGAKTP